MANEASTRAAIAALGRVDIDEIRYDSMISHRSIANQSQPNNLRIVEISGPYSQQNNNSNQNFSNESSSLTPAPAMPNRNRNANSYTPPSSIGMSSHQFGRMDYGNHPLDQRSHKSHDQMPPSYGNNSFGSSNQPSYHSSNSSNAYYDGNTNNSRFYQYPPMYSIPPPPPTMNHLPPSMPSERNYSSVYVQPYASFHGLSSSSGEIQRPSMDSTDSMIFNHSSIESNRTSNSMYPPSDHNFQQTPMDYLSNRGNHQSLANSRRPPYPKNDSQQRSYMDDFA